ncbi:hypothetical protein B5S30_g5815 [[Candida] boidinii]|nr:hypothetical protein B5S30_g5815 [[Candida] boidinii]
MAPSTRGRSRKSSAEDISPSVAPTTPIVEQTTPVVTAVEGTSSTLSEGINQPSDSEEVSADIAYDDDSPSGDELGFMVEHKKRKTKKRKHSKRGLHAKNNRDEQLVKNILTLLKQNEFESESESESGFESESESEDQNRKKNVSSKSKYLKELTIGEKRVLKKNQLFKNLKCPEFTFSSKTTEITKYIDEFKYFCKNAHMTKGVDLIEVILSSLKGQSLDWFNKVIMKEDDFDKDDYNLKTFCQVFRQKYLPSDHLLTSFRGIFSYKLDLSDTRPGFDSVLESMNEVRGKITFDQMVALWYYCLTTPNIEKRKGSTLSTLSTVDQIKFPLGVQLSEISETDKKKYKISKQIVLPIQFIADEDHVKSEFCIVDSGATANFVSKELVNRFNLSTIDISPISMSTANGQQTIITEMIETPVRVDFPTGPKEFTFNALVSPAIKNTIYFGLPC